MIVQSPATLSLNHEDQPERSLIGKSDPGGGAEVVDEEGAGDGRLLG